MDLEKIRQGTRLVLEGIGEDVEREGLVDTPDRVARAYQELCAGYEGNIQEVLSKVFQEDHNEMVIVKDIPVTSLCEHHMIPFLGKVHVAYVPDGKVLGLSKIGRLVDIFAKRLQLQERLTSQIADTLFASLTPMGVGVVLEAEHACMTTRGVRKVGSVTVTSAMRGCFLDSDYQARSEFLQLIK